MKLAKPILVSFLAILALCLLPVAASATIPNTIITSGPTGTIASTSATFAFRAEAGSDGSDPASFQCRLDSLSAASWQACTSPISYTGLVEGPHRFEVRTKNGTGEGVGSVDPSPALATFTVAVPPQTTIDSGPSGATASSAAAFSFSSSESGTFQCRLDSSSPTAWAACASPTSLAGLSEGEHSFEVRAVDAVGNIDPTAASASFSVDTVAPQTTIDSTPTGTIDIAAAAFSFSSSESGAFQCRLDSSSSEGWSTCASPASLSGLSEGTHTFEVRAIDAVGNVDVTPASATFSVDTVAPETTIDTSPPGTIDVAEAEFAFSS